MTIKETKQEIILSFLLIFLSGIRQINDLIFYLSQERAEASHHSLFHLNYKGENLQLVIIFVFLQKKLGFIRLWYNRFDIILNKF